jgi:hypothetical protein
MYLEDRTVRLQLWWVSADGPAAVVAGQKDTILQPDDYH